MKIGLISQWFSPEPAPIPSSLAEYLVQSEHDVKVLTGFPNYPAGRVYPGFRQSWVEWDEFAGSRVRRVPQYVSHDNNGFRRMLSFISFALTSLLHAHWLRDRDVVYVYGTPMTVCLAALYLRWVHRVPFVLHVQDLWPESVVDSGMIRSAWLRHAATFVLDLALRWVYRNAAHIVAIAPSMAVTLRSRGPSPDAVSVVYNWAMDRAPSVQAAALDFRNRVSSDDRWLLLYAGNVGVMQDIETIVEAAHVLGPDAGIDFVIVGDGASLAGVKDLAHLRRVPHLTFVDRIPFHEMGPIYAAADFQLVTLLDREVFRGTIPSKVGASLAAGLPIITTVSGDVESMCNSGGFGWVSLPENPESLAATCLAAVRAGRTARDAMSAAASTYYADHLSAEAGFRAIEQLLAGSRSESREDPAGNTR
jgi:colanic acid biosynthesis glycosyl transferase WcaI